MVLLKESAMKCPCGGRMSERRGDFPLEEGGAKVTLQGVRIFVCSRCASESPALPKMNGLFEAIADSRAREMTWPPPEEGT